MMQLSASEKSGVLVPVNGSMLVDDGSKADIYLAGTGPEDNFYRLQLDRAWVKLHLDRKEFAILVLDCFDRHETNATMPELRIPLSSAKARGIKAKKILDGEGTHTGSQLRIELKHSIDTRFTLGPQAYEVMFRFDKKAAFKLRNLCVDALVKYPQDGLSFVA